MNSAFTSVAVAALLLGCGSDVTKSDTGCVTTGDCEFGSVCDALVGQCVDEPKNGFIGMFRCTTYAAGAKPAVEFPGSDVIGRIDKQRFVMQMGGKCQVLDSGAVLVWTASPQTIDPATSVHLRFWLDRSRVASPGKITLVPTNSTGITLGSAQVVHLSENSADFAVLATATQGFVYLRDPLVDGEMSTLFVNLEVAAVPLP